MASILQRGARFPGKLLVGTLPVGKLSVGKLSVGKLFVGKLFVALGLVALLSACAPPRGAAILSEITEGAGAGEQVADFTVYPVTRAFLGQVSAWPVTGERLGQWLPHSHGSIQRVIRPGDSLSLAIWDASDNSLFAAPGMRVADLQGLRVSPGGTVFLPFVGPIRVAGSTPEAARAAVERAVEAVVPSAQVQLTMQEGALNSVNLVGGVAAPGRYPMPDLSTSVLDLVALGGGVRADLRNPKVKLQRRGALYVTSMATLTETPDANAILRGGDQVIIEEDRRYFLSLGASGNETVHAFPKDVVSAADALAIAGGVNDTRADPGGVLILREYPASALAPGQAGPQTRRVVFTIDLTTADGLFSARSFRINSEDLVYATESPVTNARTILGLIGSGFGLLNAAGNL